MSTITIHGASDDTVCVSGAFSEEFDSTGTDHLIGVSDGTLLRINYDRDGIWRIGVIARGTSVADHMICPTLAFDEEDAAYSDRYELTGEDIRWVVSGSDWMGA